MGKNGMLLTYRNHPILEKLKNGKMGKIAATPEEVQFLTEQRHGIQRFWADMSPKFRSNIKMLSTPFADAMILAMDKLQKTDCWADPLFESSSGTLIAGSVSICWDIEYTDYECKVSLVFMHSNVLLMFGVELIGSEQSWIWVSPNCELARGRTNSNFFKAILGDVFLYKNFIKYAPIETKVLPANKKVKDVHCKYVNQTDFNIEYLDSRWFTNLVRSEGFNVRGHFRLQAHGPKMTERRLIWINDFQKTGYTSKAKITQS